MTIDYFGTDPSNFFSQDFGTLPAPANNPRWDPNPYVSGVGGANAPTLYATSQAPAASSDASAATTQVPVSSSDPAAAQTAAATPGSSAAGRPSYNSVYGSPFDPGGLLSWETALPMAGAWLSGNFGQAAANVGAMAGQALQNQRKRTAINQMLASPQFASLTADQKRYLMANPELGASVIAFGLTPHPKQLSYNPITGQASIWDPYSGSIEPVAGQAPPGGGAFPTGFIFGGAKPYTDPSTGETGLIDINGVKAVIGHPNPSPDQAQAAGAVPLAQQADALIKQTEHGQVSGLSSAERQAMNVPMLGGPEARGFEAGKAQFLSAVRSLAISAKLNPDSVEFSEKSLFPEQGANDEEIAQKDAYRQQIITNLQKRAGPFAQQPQAPAAAATAPAQTAAPSSAAVPPGGIPAQPTNVPTGSAWSPSRHMWRSPDGASFFDAQGNPVQAQ
jgi:hypothetical protein